MLDGGVRRFTNQMQSKRRTIPESNETSVCFRFQKTCAVCLQAYCTNCAPRVPYQNHSFRICLTCQLISHESTRNEQLLELKVKQLRAYLQAKDIAHNTCTEKQELVDLIKRNRHLPFSRLLNQQQQQSSQTASKSGPFSNLQHSVSSFANQVNSFASNVQDYVANTVSEVINNTVADQPTTNPIGGPSPSGYPAQTTSNATTNPQPQPRRAPPPPGRPPPPPGRPPPPPQAAAASSHTVDRLIVTM